MCLWCAPAHMQIPVLICPLVPDPLYVLVASKPTQKRQPRTASTSPSFQDECLRWTYWAGPSDTQTHADMAGGTPQLRRQQEHDAAEGAGAQTAQRAAKKAATKPKDLPAQLEPTQGEAEAQPQETASPEDPSRRRVPRAAMCKQLSIDTSVGLPQVSHHSKAGHLAADDESSPSGRIEAHSAEGPASTSYSTSGKRLVSSPTAGDTRRDGRGSGGAQDPAAKRARVGPNAASPYSTAHNGESGAYGIQLPAPDVRTSPKTAPPAAHPPSLPYVSDSHMPLTQPGGRAPGRETGRPAYSSSSSSTSTSSSSQYNGNGMDGGESGNGARYPRQQYVANGPHDYHEYHQSTYLSTSNGNRRSSRSPRYVQSPSNPTSAPPNSVMYYEQQQQQQQQQKQHLSPYSGPRRGAHARSRSNQLHYKYQHSPNSQINEPQSAYPHSKAQIQQQQQQHHRSHQPQQHVGSPYDDRHVQNGPTHLVYTSSGSSSAQPQHGHNHMYHHQQQQQQAMHHSHQNGHVVNNTSGQFSSSQQNGSNGNNNISMPSNIHPKISKDVYMSYCEKLYDQQEDANKLIFRLEASIRKSNTMLQALKSSGQMIETLVRSHFREMQLQYGEKFGKALTNLNHRLEHLENLSGIATTDETVDTASRENISKESSKLADEETNVNISKPQQPRSQMVSENESRDVQNKDDEGEKENHYGFRGGPPSSIPLETEEAIRAKIPFENSLKTSTSTSTSSKKKVVNNVATEESC